MQLHQSGKTKRAISKLLKVSKNTVKKVLIEGAEPPPKIKEGLEMEIRPILRELYERCLGNAVRIKEVLKDEHELELGYSTLTRFIQNAELRAAKKRVGEYLFEPGEEMQHDTSPHWIIIADKKVKAQCASLVLGYSRKIFIQYYPCFTRFEAKAFLKAALEFMAGCCKRCVVDNTSVILAAGSGPDAVISPEMLTFSRMYGFEFIAHRINHADRKGKVERPFYYVETNFLAGRSFKSWEDLNQQAIEWCHAVNLKEKRVLGMAPEGAYVQEKPHLVPLPEVLPAIYEHCQRIVDSKGFVNLDSNGYSVPEKFIGKTIDVYKYAEEVRLYYQHQKIAVHTRLAGRRSHKSLLEGHHTRNHSKRTVLSASRTEAVLRGYHDNLDQYLSALKKKVRGSGHRQLNRLLHFKRTYPQEAFLYAIKKALHYGLFDINRLEDMIIKSVAGNYFNLEKEGL